MTNPAFPLPATRREFLGLGARSAGLLAFSHYAPAFLTASAFAGAPRPERDRTILVLLQLAGGNDGLNTVVPHENDLYWRLRPRLALKRDTLHPIDGHPLGLHPSLGSLHRLLAEGKIAIIQNVGYPNPNRSHFRSAEIWETASPSDDYLSTGWIGRFLDNNCGGEPGRDTPVGIHLGSETPQTFLSARPHNVLGITPALTRPRGPGSARFVERMVDPGETPAGNNLSFLQHTMMDALATERRIQRVLASLRGDSGYPQGQLSRSLRSIAALIGARMPTRVYFASLGGFDTHGNQLGPHAQLLRELGDAMTAFQSDLEARGLADQVLTMTFSEFGRRPAENQSQGTDHGTAAPLFAMGTRLAGGIHGRAPSLDVPPRGDLAFSADFRQVYATVLDRWLQCDSVAVLGERFEHVAFL